VKKSILFLFFLIVILAGCAVLNKFKDPGPVLYDNAIISIVTDNVLLIPKMPDNDFMPILVTRLNEFTKAEIQKQGDLKVISDCRPRTLKIVQDVTGITANTVTDVSTGFFLFQVFRGSATATKGDEIYINTITTVMDCQSGRTLGTYNCQGWGQNPTEALQSAAWYSVTYAYEHQRGQRR
jgi:hypothetical protein